MRVLSVGFALPDPNIDNYSFASGPTFFDYDALIVDPGALSRLIEEVSDQEGEYLTNDREPVVNGATTPVAAGLADLLRRRQGEIARALALGKPVVCFAYPNVYHHRVAGFTGCDRYYWLPAPSGVQYREPHLVPGDGEHLLVTDSDHPFAVYIDALRKRLVYRAYFSDAIPGFDSFGHVFARSAGGAAVGIELAVDAGRVIFLPPVADPGSSAERHPIAAALVDCLRRLIDQAASGPPPTWVEQYALPGLAERKESRDAATAEVERARAKLDEAETQFQELDRFRRLLWQEGKFGLATAVREAFRLLEFQVTADPDEPLTLYATGEKILVEVEGSADAVTMVPHYRLRRRLEEAIAETGRPQRGLLVVNGHRLKNPDSRPGEFIDALRVAADSMRYCVLTSTQLFAVVKRHLEGDALVARSLRKALASCEGVFDPSVLETAPSATSDAATTA